MDPKIIYIASPYTLGDVAVNVRTQMEAAHTILNMGHVPIAPLLSHFLHIHRPRPYKDWVSMDLALIRRVDIVLRLPGKSKGADKEVAIAQLLLIPVVFGWKQLSRALAVLL